MKQRAYADRDNWLGSFYELGIEYPPGSDAGRVMGATRALWRHPLLDGPMAGPYSDQSASMPAVLPSVIENMSKLYGLLHLPGNRAVGCLTMIMNPGDNPLEVAVAEHATWVILCIPTGMLNVAYPVKYPIESATNPWIDEFERVLVDIAESVYRVVPFDLAVIGEEATAVADGADELTGDMLDRGGYLASPQLAHKLKPRRPPEALPSGLLRFPWAA